MADPKIVKPTDVIVRIGGAGVCRTDLHIVEGIWREKVSIALPYIMGHENAGWVEEVGKGVTGVKVGDAVICHPLVTSGHCLACRRGNDMHAADSCFPGINANGGYAQYLLTGERSLIKLPKTLAPKDVAPYTDAGLTAYRAAKKASRHLLPGQYAVVLGVGGLGHIGIQVLESVVRGGNHRRRPVRTGRWRSPRSAAPTISFKADGIEVEAVLQLTKGRGAEAVIDFVGEGDAIAKGLAMTCNDGYYYIVGYGGRIEIPTIDMITSEKTIVGNLVGTYAELVELMALADRGPRQSEDQGIQAQRRQRSAARPSQRQDPRPRGAHPMMAAANNKAGRRWTARRFANCLQHRPGACGRAWRGMTSWQTPPTGPSMLERHKIVVALIEVNSQQLRCDSACRGPRYRAAQRATRRCTARQARRKPKALPTSSGARTRSRPRSASSRRSATGSRPRSRNSTRRCGQRSATIKQAEQLEDQRHGSAQSKRHRRAKRGPPELSEEDRSKDEFFTRSPRLSQRHDRSPRARLRHGRAHPRGALHRRKQTTDEARGTAACGCGSDQGHDHHHHHHKT